MLSDIENVLRREGYKQYMIIKIYIDNPDNVELTSMYTQHINNHIRKMLDTPKYIDAGFDVLVPNSFSFPNTDISQVKVNFGIKCEAYLVYLDSSNYGSNHTGFYMYPRSSLSKTPLRLANCVGIIDSGYRGNLIGIFDKSNTLLNSSVPIYDVVKGDRLVQICAPGLVPIVPVLVDEMDTNTSRGEGGFGSTGK